MSVINTGLIFDIKRFSIHDGPGIRTTIFLKGCPLHCAWCHNPEGISPLVEILFWENRCISCYECIKVCNSDALRLVDGKRSYTPALCKRCGDCAQVCPAEAIEIVGTNMSVQELMKTIKKDIIFFDESGGGVTFSGGEPLQQVDFVEDALIACKEIGIHTTVDTAGHVPFESLLRIIPYTDLFLFDIKFIDSKKHTIFTDASTQVILSNFKKLAKSGAKLVPRIPIIPGINNDEENIDQIGRFINQFKTIDKIDILPYHHTAINKYQRMGHHYLLEGVKPPREEQLIEISKQLEHFGLQVSIGG